jgi:NTP pyrophosphatase (non-canonical NTP hydrolase)
MELSEKIEEKHREIVRALAKPGRIICEEMTPRKAHLMHMVMGVAGEAGELLDAIKKHTIYQQDLDYLNVIEELGDLEFYLRGLREELNINRDVVLQENCRKLERRYATRAYTDLAAKQRQDKHEAS